jgi:hypothetical protein
MPLNVHNLEGDLHMRDVSQNTPAMTLTDFRTAALISILLVLPFAVLESLNQGITMQNARGASVLVSVLWLLPTVFIVLLMPVVRNLRRGHSVFASPVNLLLRVALLAVVAMFWGRLLIDQMPCFLGVPNCD